METLKACGSLSAKLAMEQTIDADLDVEALSRKLSAAHETEASTVMEIVERLVLRYNYACAVYLQGDLNMSRHEIDRILSCDEASIFPKLIFFATILQLEICLELKELEYAQTALHRLVEFHQWTESTERARCKRYYLHDEEPTAISTDAIEHCEDEDALSLDELSWACEYYQTRLLTAEGRFESALAVCSKLLSKRHYDVCARLLYAYLLLKQYDADGSVSHLSDLEVELVNTKWEQRLENMELERVLINNNACIQIAWNRPVSARVLLLKCFRESEALKKNIPHLKSILHNLISAFAIAGDIPRAKELELILTTVFS
jgi:hypothetical protein